MSFHILAVDIIFTASIAYLFLIWKTNSLYTSYTTTLGLITTIVVCLLVKVQEPIAGSLVFLAGMSLAVWRVIPHSEQDSWAK